MLRERALRLNARVCEGIAQSGTARPRTPSPSGCRVDYGYMRPDVIVEGIQLERYATRGAHNA